MFGNRQIAERYRQLRAACIRVHRGAEDRVPAVFLNRWGREFGMWEDDRLAFVSEAEYYILLDFCLYSAPYRGKTVMEAYLDGLDEPADPDERFVREAMRNHRYGALEVTRPRKGIGVEAVDFFRPDAYFIADIGLSLSLKKGRLMASRLLPLPEFWITGGAAFPLPDVLTMGLDPFAADPRPATAKTPAKPRDWTRKDEFEFARLAIGAGVEEGTTAEMRTLAFPHDA